ncbi:response regulator [Pelomonas sp. SE-A7]|uniref:response regulator n=1 Tax=Pelomonas sp. SE-A7 TaxID=3054953 RepID=UPI00259C7211|nr:response regulator [Pelomonas sp. SE-A7]MDM4768166.1 response regulator [Pelomonas sp. SE-A7]
MTAAARKQLLLVDPHSLFRRTVALVARQLDVADVAEAVSLEAARHRLEQERFDALLLDIGDGVESLALMQSLRAGQLRSARDLPVALMAEQVDPATIELFKPLGLARIMLKPFKVKTALEVVSQLAMRPGYAAGPH